MPDDDVHNLHNQLRRCTQRRLLARNDSHQKASRKRRGRRRRTLGWRQASPTGFRPLFPTTIAQSTALATASQNHKFSMETSTDGEAIPVDTTPGWSTVSRRSRPVGLQRPGGDAYVLDHEASAPSTNSARQDTRKGAGSCDSNAHQAMQTPPIRRGLGATLDLGSAYSASDPATGHIRITATHGPVWLSTGQHLLIMRCLTHGECPMADRAERESARRWGRPADYRGATPKQVGDALLKFRPPSSTTPVAK